MLLLPSDSAVLTGRWKNKILEVPGVNPSISTSALSYSFMA